jgi:hypothetical protein
MISETVPTCIARPPAVQIYLYNLKLVTIVVIEVEPGSVETNGSLQTLSCEAMDV